jgi:hypothetical protein
VAAGEHRGVLARDLGDARGLEHRGELGARQRQPLRVELEQCAEPRAAVGPRERAAEPGIDLGAVVVRDALGRLVVGKLLGAASEEGDEPVVVEPAGTVCLVFFLKKNVSKFFFKKKIKTSKKSKLGH